MAKKRNCHDEYLVDRSRRVTNKAEATQADFRAMNLMVAAQREIDQEDDRAEIDRLKIKVRQSRQTLMARMLYAVRYMKPTIKWEYRKNGKR